MYIKIGCFLAFIFFLINPIFAQNTFTIYGYVQDNQSHEKLINASIFDKITQKGTITNNYGFFSLTLPSDSVKLMVSYIGYQTQHIDLFITENKKLEVNLQPAILLETVEIKEQQQTSSIESTQMSQISLPIEQIKAVPAALGEVDILRTFQLMPGVQAGAEGQTGFYVRGGSPDQNLILLDGVPIYNPGHALGFLSTFNPDAIKNTKLTKGGFPARYGGRLSSVLEINMKEGNLKEFHGEGAVGIVSSKLTLEGPLIKNKTSFLFSGRRTYLDILARPLIKSYANGGVSEKVKPKLYFYDINLKIQHKINDKHRLFLSSYSTKDIFYFNFINENESIGGGIDWDNFIGALRWNWQANPKLFLNTSMTFSEYNNTIETKYEITSGGSENRNFLSRYQSGIRDIAFKSNLDFVPNSSHYIRLGSSLTLHQYKPGAVSLTSTIEDIIADTLIGNQHIMAKEWVAFLEDDISWGNLKTNIGLHFSNFNVQNKNYSSFQPRVGLRYLIAPQWSIKASYSVMQQYINLLSSSALSLPTDLWVPSTEQILPQNAWQIAFGTTFNLPLEVELTLEGFYKKMNNVISYKEGVNFLTQENLELEREFDWENQTTQGVGTVYGLEFFLQKKEGKTTGWLGYTLSWNWRQFSALNLGRPYPYRYDRRHDISLVILHQLKPNINISATWIYGTGNAISLPLYRYAIDYQYHFDTFSNRLFEWYPDVNAIGAKNSFRMSDYHRLDCSITFSKKKKKYERKWILGAYNTYFHANPFTVIPSSKPVDEKRERYITTFKEISILPFLIPSVTYHFKF